MQQGHKKLVLTKACNLIHLLWEKYRRRRVIVFDHYVLKCKSPTFFFNPRTKNPRNQGREGGWDFFIDLPSLVVALHRRSFPYGGRKNLWWCLVIMFSHRTYMKPTMLCHLWPETPLFIVQRLLSKLPHRLSLLWIWYLWIKLVWNLICN